MRSLTSVSREQEVLCCAILVVVHGDFRLTVAEFEIGKMWKMLRGLLKAGFEGYIIAASKKCQHELRRGATCVMLTNSENLK